MQLSQADQKILKRLLNKDEKALREFYDIHRIPLTQYLMRTLSIQDAEEVLQDAFIAFVESLRNFQGRSSLKTFLYSIAKRKAIDKLRRKKFKRVLFSYFPDYVVDSLAKVFLKDTLDKKHLAQKIERVLEDLPNEYAQVLRLKYIEGYKVTDIAVKIQLSFKATESLLFRARKAFIKVYTDYERQGILTFEETL